MLGFWFTRLFPGDLPKIGGLWSAISAVVVTQVSRKDAASSDSLRVLGSAIGAITRAVYLTLLRFLESCIGKGVALLAVWLWPGSRRQPLDEA